MKKWIALILLVGLFAGCNKPQKKPDQEFEIKYLNLSITGNLYRLYTYHNLIIGMFFDGQFFVLDSNYNHLAKVENQLNSITPKISDLLIHKEDLLLFLENRKIVVLDSNFEHKRKIETRLHVIEASSGFVYGDSLFLLGSKKIYQETSDYHFIGIDRDTFRGMRRIFVERMSAYSDSRYDIFACGVGEFGGNVYFRDRKTKKEYSLPCYFGQIFPYKNAYHLIEEYRPGTKFLKIKDPSRLYPAMIEEDLYSCLNRDSGYKRYYDMTPLEKKKWQKERDVTTYFESNAVQTLKTFTLNGGLYSLCIADTSFIILQHTDSVRCVKAVPRMQNKNRNYHITLSAEINDKMIIGLSGTYWQLSDSGGLDTEIDQFALIIIKGNKIEVYESYSPKLVKVPRNNR